MEGDVMVKKRALVILAMLLISITLITSSCGGTTNVTTPKTSNGGTGESPSTGDRVMIFPNQSTVDLDFPNLLLYANVDSVHVKAPSDEKYNVGWYLNNKLISSESNLTTAPFLKAIGNQEGTYAIKLVVWDKAGTQLGESTASVTAKKQKPILLTMNVTGTWSGTYVLDTPQYTTSYKVDMELTQSGSKVEGTLTWGKATWVEKVKGIYPERFGTEPVYGTVSGSTLTLGNMSLILQVSGNSMTSSDTYTNQNTSSWNLNRVR
jgi:hypothetical protein